MFEGVSRKFHGKSATPLRQADVKRTGRGIAEALITPALFSQPPPRPPGEEGEVSLKEEEGFSCFFKDFPLPSLPADGGEAGREGLGE